MRRDDVVDGVRVRAHGAGPREDAVGERLEGQRRASERRRVFENTGWVGRWVGGWECVRARALARA